MTIFKIKNKKNCFTTISNQLPQSGKVSLKALGLWAYLMTLPADWEIQISELATHFPDGEKTIRTTMNELIKSGYVKKEQSRKKDGHFEKNIYLVFAELPENESKNENELPFIPEQQETQETQETKSQKPQINETKEKNIYERIETDYTEKWHALYSSHVLRTPEPAIPFEITRRRIKQLSKQYDESFFYIAIENAFYDDWIIKNGFALSMILSNNIFNRLINKTIDKSEINQTANEQYYSPGICPECSNKLKFGICSSCGYQEVE